MNDQEMYFFIALLSFFVGVARFCLGSFTLDACFFGYGPFFSNNPMTFPFMQFMNRIEKKKKNTHPLGQTTLIFIHQIFFGSIFVTPSSLTMKILSA